MLFDKNKILKNEKSHKLVISASMQGEISLVENDLFTQRDHKRIKSIMAEL